MKKTLTLTLLLAAASVAMGETLLDLDFTKTDTTTLTAMAAGTLENGGTWTFGKWRGEVNQFKIDEQGLYAGEGNGWNRNYGSTTFDAALDFSTNAYVIELKLKPDSADYNGLLVLSGSSGSYVFGNSYNVGGGFQTGSVASNVFGTGSSMPRFGKVDGTTEVTALTQTGTLDASQEVTYRVRIVGSTMTVQFIGADKTISNTYTVDDSLGSFDTIGLVLDGPDAKVKSLTATSTANMMWAGDEDATWSDGGAGFHLGNTSTEATYSNDYKGIVVFCTTDEICSTMVQVHKEP